MIGGDKKNQASYQRIRRRGDEVREADGGDRSNRGGSGAEIGD